MRRQARGRISKRTYTGALAGVVSGDAGSRTRVRMNLQSKRLRCVVREFRSLLKRQGPRTGLPS